MKRHGKEGARQRKEAPRRQLSGILGGEGGGQHHWIRGGGDKEAVGR